MSFYFDQDKNPDAFLLQVDFEAAFDSVQHFYMRQPGSTLHWCWPILYQISSKYNVLSGMKMSVIVNDQQTMFINVKNGLPQGCALSAILFIIAEEPLLCAAKNCVSSSSYRTKDRNVLSNSLDSELRLADFSSLISDSNSKPRL